MISEERIENMALSEAETELDESDLLLGEDDGEWGEDAPSSPLADSDQAPLGANPADPKDGMRRYLNEIGRFGVLSQEEEVALAKAAKAGDGAARDTLFRHNARLVASIAKKHLHKKVSMEDLNSWGSIGLGKALDGFDPDRGCKFSTYATKWIESAIADGVNEGRNIISRSQYAASMTGATLKIADRLRETLGREPTNAEIAEASEGKLSEDMAASYRQIAGMTVASMDMSLSEGDSRSATLGDMLADEGNDTPEEAYMKAELNAAVYEALGELESRFPKKGKAMRRILTLRFGLADGNRKTEGERGIKDGKEHTLEEIAAILCDEGVCGQHGQPLTKERVRQMEAEASEWLGKQPKLRSVVYGSATR